MKSAELQNNIVQHIKGLPEEALQEILDFVQFLRYKKGQNYPADNINYELDKLDNKELQHLERELANYKDLYPLNEPNRNE
jgi:hypothetical protein